MYSSSLNNTYHMALVSVRALPGDPTNSIQSNPTTFPTLFSLSYRSITVSFRSSNYLGQTYILHVSAFTRRDTEVIAPLVSGSRASRTGHCVGFSRGERQLVPLREELFKGHTGVQAWLLCH